MTRVLFMTMSRLPCTLIALALVACGKTPPAPSPTSTTEPSAEAPTTSSAAPVVDEKPPPKDATASEGETLFVDSAWIDCEGEGPMKCMRVKKSADGEWELMYSGIEGFEFEAGHAYELRVKIDKQDDPPAGASSLTYTLVEVVSKKEAK